MHFVIVAVLVMRDHGSGLRFVILQPLLHHFRHVVCATDQPFPIEVAHAPSLGRLEQNVINAAALRSLTPGRDSLYEYRERKGEVNNGGLWISVRLEKTVQKICLR